MVPTENDFIDDIGGSFLDDFNTKTEFYLNQYYHKTQISTVKKLVPTSVTQVVDLGCSEGSWYNDLKKLGFDEIIGIDISEERLKKAREKGYSKTITTNAKHIPLENNSIDFIFSNDMLVHVLNDDDKIQIFKECKRILKNNATLLFDFASDECFGKKMKEEYCKAMNLETMKKLVQQSGLTVEKIIPAYFLFPLKLANPIFAKYSSKIIFPITDLILKKLHLTRKAVLIYIQCRKIETNQLTS